ncbi:protein Fe65 homolog [Atheta coriaria]|uniref:protein Fe65 homolog n=1 Tax=Dalotia coriaria TaxID=877792 RepID=UPI0031F3D56E
MLCGEFHHRAPLGLLQLSLSDTRSPYSSLLALVQGMAAITAHAAQEDEDIFLENGLLSYENPNYHLDPARLDDALNSNNTADEIYEDLYQELDDICNMGHKSAALVAPNRKTYAALDIGSMGVDINTGPQVTHIDSSNYPDNRSICEKSVKNIKDNRDEEEEMMGIPHIAGELNNDLYAIPVKRRTQKSPDEIEVASPDKERSDETDLPPGWEKHEDNDGPYYWHIKSGTIQRELPEMPNNDKLEKSDAKCDFKETDSLIQKFESVTSSVTRSSTSSALDLDLEERKKKDELAFKRRSYPARPEPESKDRPIRFAVRSLGWVEIAEEDLTPERSSKAVNKCIVDLSLGRNDLLDVVGRWGDGKDLFMDLDEGALKLIDPENLTVLNTQPIHTIRVWGVGRDNGRDFAYVARDRTTRKHMCHVFRCDMPARTIANTLRDICKKIMIERSLQQNLAKPIDINGRGLATRPTNLPTEHRRSNRNGQALVTQSFPTPMEEPKKVLRAQYLGSLQVNQATGMEVLNDAIERLVSSVPQEQWQSVNVAVAPSMISIQQPSDDKLITECRVRYLSFLGIGRNVKQCAFVMHTAQDTFVAHVFHCEPSSGALCKTVEAACKLRYQKCLDAHPQGLGRSQSNLHTPGGKSIGAALKSIVGSLTGRKSKSAES